MNRAWAFQAASVRGMGNSLPEEGKCFPFGPRFDEVVKTP